MYNEKLKIEFINNGNSKYPRGLYKHFFEKIEQYEKSIDTDICKMDISQLVNAFSIFGTRTSIQTMIPKIRIYTEWCFQNGYCNINNLDKSYAPPKVILERISDDAGFSERYYISPNKYIELKRELWKNSPNQIYYTSIFMAVYEGLSGNKCVNMGDMRLRDIDTNGKRVRCFDGSTKYITEELHKLLVECEKLTVRYDENKEVPYKYSKYYDSIWKEVRETENHEQKFARIFSTQIKKYCNDENVTLDSVERSGFFNFIVNKIKERNLTDEFIHDMKEKNQRGIKISGKGKSSGFSPVADYKKYDFAFEEYGTNIRMYEFKHQYFDWIKYI